jgi:hypothetical protein
LHFAGSSNRFDNKRNSVPVIDRNPISKTFTRKIIYCKRCNNRVVSNVSHCPYCGKNLLPLHRRFVFWLVITVIIAAAAVAIIIFSPGIPASEPPPKEPVKPIVVGAPDGAPVKDLRLGTTVDCDNLLVTVTDSSGGLVSASGGAITTVHVQFINKGPEAVTLFLTQWQLEGANATRVDSEPMKTQEGQDVKSDLDSTSLAPGATFTATLYFSVDQPTKAVFAPDPLLYSEESLVTWTLAVATPAEGEGDGGGGAEGSGEGGGAEGGAGGAEGQAEGSGGEGA